MSDDAIMENYANITHNLSSIKTLEKKIEMLDARVLRLEEIIVKVCNEEPDEEHFSIEDLAEIALEQRTNEDRGEDR